MEIHRPTIRVLFQSATVIVGDERCPLEHPDFGREVPNCVWPCIAFPRVPCAVSHEQFGRSIADPNTAVLYNVGRMYRRSALDRRGAHNDWIDVAPEILADMMAEFDPAARDRGGSAFAWADAPIPAPALLRQRLDFRRLSFGHFDAIGIEEGALAGVGAVLAAGYGVRAGARPGRSESHARFHREAVEEVRLALARRMSERLTLADLARAVHVSQFHLCRLFRRYTGTSIHRYLDQLRLRRAMEMIECGGTTMAQVAMATGYVSESHFSDAFKRELGVRPTEYRAGLNGGNTSRKGVPAPEPTLLDLGEMCRGSGPGPGLAADSPSGGKRAPARSA